MIRIAVTPILLGFLALIQQIDPTGRWIHNGPIGEVIIELRADKGYELILPGSALSTGTWEQRENHVILMPADNSKPTRIDIRSIGDNQINIDFRNGMAMDFVRAGVKIIETPEEDVSKDVADNAAANTEGEDASKLFGEWYWESGDDDMTLEVYPDGTYYFDYWIGDEDYDSEGTYKLRGDSLELTPEDGEVLTLTILQIQPGEKILIRLAYGKEYWLELEDTFDPDDY